MIYDDINVNILSTMLLCFDTEEVAGSIPASPTIFSNQMVFLYSEFFSSPVSQRMQKYLKKDFFGKRIGTRGKEIDGGQSQNRTADTRLFRPLLYRLS